MTMFFFSFVLTYIRVRYPNAEYNSFAKFSRRISKIIPRSIACAWNVWWLLTHYSKYSLKYADGTVGNKFDFGSLFLESAILIMRLSSLSQATYSFIVFPYIMYGGLWLAERSWNEWRIWRRWRDVKTRRGETNKINIKVLKSLISTDYFPTPVVIVENLLHVFVNPNCLTREPLSYFEPRVFLWLSAPHQPNPILSSTCLGKLTMFQHRHSVLGWFHNIYSNKCGRFCSTEYMIFFRTQW